MTSTAEVNKQIIFERNLEAIGFYKTRDRRYMLRVLGEYSYVFAYYDMQDKEYKLRGSLTFQREYNTIPLDDDFNSEAEILQRIVDLTTKLNLV